MRPTQIVREERAPQGSYWRRGDGYHRAVVLCIEGRERISVFAGLRRPAGSSASLMSILLASRIWNAPGLLELGDARRRE